MESVSSFPDRDISFVRAPNNGANEIFSFRKSAALEARIFNKIECLVFEVSACSREWAGEFFFFHLGRAGGGPGGVTRKKIWIGLD